MQFDERLKYLRMEKGLSEKELADELQATESSIRLYEKGKLDVNLDMLERMANFFGVSTKLLLGTIFEDLPAEEAIKSYRLVQELEAERQKAAAENNRHSEIAKTTPSPLPAAYSAKSFDTLYVSTVAIYSKLAGNNPADWAAYIEDYWPVSVSIINIYGNDLSNYFYVRVNGDHMRPTLNPGEVILIKKQSDLQNNDVGLVLCDWGEAIVARITHSVDKVVLYFDNQSFPAQVYEANQCRVVGKVLWKTTRPPG